METAVSTGKRIGYAGHDSRRAVLGVVAWIVILIGGYCVVADWPALPHLASSLLTSVH
jgi:hypothetical protein